MTAPAVSSRFAGAVARLASSRIGARERRRFRRAPIVVGGRMLDAFGREHDCRTADISPGDARLAAPIIPEPGQRVVIYLEGFGRLSGIVARACGENEFAVIFDMSPHKREKMAELLTLRMNADRLDPDDGAGASGSPTHARIETEDGQIIDGQVLDFSLAGVTIRSAKPPPPLGAWVRVGTIYGRVARRIDNGFAVDFAPRNTPPPVE